MNLYDCEAIRDLLPSLVREELPAHEASSAGQHLAECAECSAEAEIVRLLQTSLAPVPSELESRVLLAVRRRAGRRRVPARLAMAATVAAVVMGGVVLVQQRQGSGGTPDLNAVSWAAAEDPLLHGGSSLHDLSVEELEALLAELDQ